ncbi:ABC transporter permease [Acidobacteria bacterium AB60]|nr:ABC transporter permease [Acidobacteria bacterium AB60]
MRLLRGPGACRDFDAELQSHIEMHTEEGVRSGLSQEQARREALLRLGGVDLARQLYRQRATVPWLGALRQDFLYAMRGFRRSPVFTVTAVLTLALGIGATTAVFSVVDRILFRALPYADPAALVSVGVTAPIVPQEFVLGAWYYQWRDHALPFSSITSEAGEYSCDLTEHNPLHLSCVAVEASFLPTLGVTPIIGRNFLPEEDRPHGPRAALISHELWKSHYGRDPDIVNRIVDLDGAPVRVVGVLSSNFEMPGLEHADILVPQAVDASTAGADRVMFAFARLKPGVTSVEAVEQLKPDFAFALSKAPDRFRNEVRLTVRPLRDRRVHNARQSAVVLLGAVVAVLLIACANVTSLLFTRASTRQREQAVRFALGASRGRIIAQAMMESLLLAAFGTLTGAALAEGLLRLFVAMAPSGMPFLRGSQLDLRIAVFAVLIGILCGIVFGLIPAFHRPPSLAVSARTSASGVKAMARKAMVVAQIAISMVLLAGAALLVRSFMNLQAQPLGLRTRGILTARVYLNRYRYVTPESRMQFFVAAETALRKLPGVTAVGLSDSVPPGDDRRNHIYSIMEVAGRPPMTGATGGMVAWRWVTPEYFRILGVPIVRGQSFTEQQRTSKEHFMILSSSLAARLFPGEDPLGQHIKPVPNGPWFTVVGVAANVKNSGLTEEDAPEYYQLWRSEPEDWQQPHAAVLTVETTLGPRAMESWVRSQIGAIDATVPVEVEPLTRRVVRLADRPRFETALLGFFALAGLAMAIIGLYGVMAFRAVQRTQEIGVRMALGARRGDVLKLMVLEGARLIVAGTLLGLAAALAVSRLLKSMLFSIGPHDPLSFSAVTLMLATVALLATLVPARHAASVEPRDALRAE